MKKYIMIMALFFSVGVSATTATSKQETPSKDINYGHTINKRIASKFCAGSDQCASFLALELEDAYKAGRAEKREHNAWDFSISKYAKTKRNLCDNAPDKRMCWAYRDALLGRYMAGLSSRD